MPCTLTQATLEADIAERALPMGRWRHQLREWIGAAGATPAKEGDNIVAFITATKVMLSKPAR